MNLVPWYFSESCRVLIAKWRSTSWSIHRSSCRKQGLAGKELEAEFRVQAEASLYMLQACLGRLSHSQWRPSQTVLSSLLSTSRPPTTCVCLSELNKREQHFVCRSQGSLLFSMARPLVLRESFQFLLSPFAVLNSVKLSFEHLFWAWHFYQKLIENIKINNI